MRWFAALALAACSAPSSPAPPAPPEQPVNAAPADARVVPALDAEPPVADLASTPVALTSPPGALVAAAPADITEVAIAADGTIAVTADLVGAVRLWPSLDGKREPVIVAMHAALTLAVGRDADGIAIAGLDAIGQLELVRTTAAGEPLSRLMVESARPFRSVHAVTAGMLALRDDDEIVLFDAAGTVLGSLPAAAQQRVRTLAVHGDRVLALVEADGVVRGQWLELAGALRWGESTPALPIDPEHAALSPSHRRLAAGSKGGRVALVDLATGRMLRRGEDGSVGAEVVGFLSEGSVAVQDRFRVQLLNADLESVDELAATNAAVADKILVGGGSRAALIVTAHGRSRWLGYRIVGDLQVAPHGDGFTITDGQSIAEVGHDLRARKVHAVAAGHGPMNGAQLVGDEHVVTGFTAEYPTYPDAGVVDIKRGKVASLGTGYIVGFERSTGILAIVREQTLDVRRYDRKRGAFGEAVSITIDKNASIVMLDGKHGDLAVAVSHDDKRIVSVDVFRLRDELELVKTRTVTPPDEWWDFGGFLAFVPPSWQPSRARPSPDHSMTAQVRDGRIELRGADGTERWLVPAAGASDVLWTPAGELVAVGAGIARIDLATGALRERQCGWQFGLWSEELLAMSNPSLCEAP